MHGHRLVGGGGREGSMRCHLNSGSTVREDTQTRSHERTASVTQYKQKGIKCDTTIHGMKYKSICTRYPTEKPY